MTHPAAYSLETLEFEKALDLYRRRLRTPLSVPLLLQSRPTCDRKWLETRFNEVDRASRFLEAGQTFPFEGIRDITPILRQAEVAGAVCEGIDLWKVLETLRGIHRIRQSLEKAEIPLGPLEVFLHRLIPLTGLETVLAEALEADGSLRDSASPQLKKLRSTIRRQRTHIQKKLEELCRRPEIRNLLQEEYVTERHGRYVLPVQASQKKKIRGIQHGRSDRGTTVYIEPLDIVEAGNLLAESVEEESREVTRILKELTRQVHQNLQILQADLETVAELDLVVSLADYLLDVRGELPRIVEEGNLVLRNGRHPLLLSQMPAEQVVPNDLTLTPETAGILITGPNTGGKTVVLKTAGLLCLLALSGLPIPCGSGTTIPLLGGILADIGDDQSIEESLSTFSSHVSRMKTFLETADEMRVTSGHRVLVLLDELGAGTDPAEGAALGRAFLEALMEKGVWVLVATHLGDLKLFGYSHPRLVSASMEFDRSTFSPTYRLLLDTVGESHGLEIARRLGLLSEVVDRATELMETNPNQALAVLHRLTEEEKSARESRKEAQKVRRDLEEKREALIRRIEETRRKEREILDRARKEAERKITGAKRRVARIEEILEKEEKKLRKGLEGREEELTEREKRVTWLEKELEDRLKALSELARKFPNFAPEILRPDRMERLKRLHPNEPEWKRILRALNEEEDSLAREFPVSSAETLVVQGDLRPRWHEIRPGDLVRVEGLDRPVAVEEKDEKRKRLRVLVGNLESEIPWNRVLGRCSAVPRKDAETPDSSPAGVTHRVRSDLSAEINLIGKTVEEMEPLLRRYLDDAALSGWDEVRIVHGFGTGVLRNAVRRILAEHPAVRDYRPGGPYEGGGGATVAVLTK